MAKTNKTRFAILGMLSMGAMSGYDIKRAVDESVSHFWTENFGHIYPMLHQLLTEGMVELVPSPPPRKVYALTAAGREAFLAWLGSAPEVQPPRNELLLQLFLGEPGSKEMVEKLRAERERQGQRAAAYAAIRARVAENPNSAAPSWDIVLRYGERVNAAVLAWCDECLAEHDAAEKAKTTGSD